MYICMYMYVCMYTYIRMQYICMYVFIYLCIHIHAYIYTCLYCLDKDALSVSHVIPIYEISFKVFDILYILPLLKSSSEIRPGVYLIYYVFHQIQSLQIIIFVNNNV